MTACLLLLPLTLSAAPPQDGVAPLRKAVAEMTVRFDRYVLPPDEKDSKPRPRLDTAPLTAAGWNRAILSHSFHGEGNVIGYALRLKFDEKRRPLHRFVTLFRAAEEVADDRKFADHAALAKAMGLDEKVVERNAELVKRVLRDRTYGEWSRDPQAARLMVGLALSKQGKGQANKWDDAFAIERQWWVDLKRTKIYPKEPFYLSKPFVCPTPLEEAARVVREGSEKEAGVKEGTAKKLDEALKELEKNSTEAFAVCVVRNGVIVLHKAYGKRDGKPMTVDTPSWMASVTKTMSATLMLMLLDQGKVKLDDPVEKYLPPLRGLRRKNPLTIHHLYTHTNGLTLDGYPGWNDEMPDAAERVAAYYDRLRVGDKWAYTGTGNTLGSKVFEMVTGEAVPQAYHKHLLSPLGCTNTHVTDTHAGAFSIPLDMAKFGQMLLNRGSYGKQRFFSEKTFADVMLPRRLDKLLGEETKKTFGFGLDGSPERFGHGTASGATFHVDAKRKLVVIMTRNKYVNEQGKYGGLFWKALDEGIEAAKK